MVTDAQRRGLYDGLEEMLGSDRAETLMELMPPVGWADVATKRDLDALEERMHLRFELVDQRFDLVDRRFEMLEQRFETSEHKLMAAFRAELLAQSNVITTQTRTLVMVNIGAMLTLATLAFGAARLT